jgi:hypothetical protein
VGLFKHLARYNLNQCKLSRADSCQGRHVSFNQKGENTKGKVTEHEVPGGDAPNDDTRITVRPLTFPAGDQYIW